MLQILKNSQTSVVIRVKLRSALNGQGLTGLSFSSSGLIVGTIAGNEATATAYTAAGSTIETITTLGTFAAPTSTKCRFKEVDATNHPGVYELQIADARWAVASAKALLVTVSGATNLIECDALVPLWSVDPFDAVRFGQSALPNATAGAAGGVPLGDASGRVDLGKWLGSAPDALSSGKVPADLKLWLTAAPAALSTNGYVQVMLLRWLTDNAGGTPDALSSGKLPADVKLWLATAPASVTANGYLKTALLRWLTDDAAGTPAALDANAFVKADVEDWKGSTAPAMTGDAYARLGAPAGASVSADVAAVKSDTAAIKTDVESTGVVVAAGSKTGYALTSAYDPAKTAAQAGDAMALTSGERTTLTATIWNALTSGLTTVASIGKLLVDNINATISSRSTYDGSDTGGTTTLLGRLTNTRAGNLDNLDTTISSRTKPADTQAAVTTVTNVTNAPTAGDFTAAMKTSLNAATPAVTVSDKTGFSLSAAGVQAVWDALTAAFTTPGSIGKRVVDYLTGDSYARLGAPAGASIAADLAAVKTDVDALPSASAIATAVAAQVATDHGAGSYIRNTEPLDAAATRSAVGLASANLDTQLALIASYIDTEVGALVSNVATILTRLGVPSSDVATLVAAIKAKTDALPASPAATGDAMALTSGERDSVATALLDLANGVETGVTTRETLRLILAVLAGKVSGADTNTPVFRDVNDATDRVTATTDASGNRLTVTVNGA